MAPKRTAINNVVENITGKLIEEEWNMVCPKCGSENVTVQMVTEVREKRKKGWLYWILIGWLWEPIAWLFLTLPKLLVAIFSRKTKTVSTTTKQAVCQDCGHNWKVGKAK